MSLISDDSGALFGIFLFLVLTVMAVISWLVIAPYMDGIDAAFDQDYRDEYLSTEGQGTADILKFMFDNTHVLLVVIIAAMMVINRAILIGDTK